MQEKQKKAIRWISPVLIALTALIVWRVNYEIEFMMDDEWYSTVLYADTPIRNLSDIIHAQIWHYFNWGCSELSVHDRISSGIFVLLSEI